MPLLIRVVLLLPGEKGEEPLMEVAGEDQLQPGAVLQPGDEAK